MTSGEGICGAVAQIGASSSANIPFGKDDPTGSAAMPSSCRPSLKTAAVVLLSLSLLAVLYFVIGSWAIFEFLAEACQWIRHNRKYRIV